MIQRLTAQEAVPYFTEPCEEWMQYRALGGVCGAFHAHLWPGVWMGHLGARREAWGHLDAPARAIVASFADEVNAARIVGWVKESNRPMLALCRRIGFETDGRLPLAEPVLMVGWGRTWQ